ncbi:unnamed protein product [Ambrosiozyma monospora]|uniref:Unnamed protein product n=1 Tax=Ambrosiozyma monospora TaxID=43982 RepID=A0ACB5T874_AMBMO|nr:unnamed protein product [Ambrosiozyma monospora]
MSRSPAQHQNSSHPHPIPTSPSSTRPTSLNIPKGPSHNHPIPSLLLSSTSKPIPSGPSRSSPLTRYTYTPVRSQQQIPHQTQPPKPPQSTPTQQSPSQSQSSQATTSKNQLIKAVMNKRHRSEQRYQSAKPVDIPDDRNLNFSINKSMTAKEILGKLNFHQQQGSGLGSASGQPNRTKIIQQSFNPYSFELVRITFFTIFNLKVGERLKLTMSQLTLLFSVFGRCFVEQRQDNIRNALLGCSVNSSTAGTGKCKVLLWLKFDHEYDVAYFSKASKRGHCHDVAACCKFCGFDVDDGFDEFVRARESGEGER